MNVKKISKIVYKLILILFALLFIVFIYYTGGSWWRHWVTYPALEKDRVELWEKYEKPQKVISLDDHKGVLHLHSYWSHDSRGILQELLPAAKKAKLKFLFFADHPHAKLDTFPRSYSGVYDGILFEPGTENGGMMVCPMDSVVLDWSKESNEFIHDVVKNGGLVLYVHTEKPHDWSNHDYQGMEIYNIHTDLLDEEGGLLPLIINFAINGSCYRHWAFRDLYDDQIKILANWDSLNRKRRIVGMGAVDAHNNQNVRARYLADGRVEWVGPNAKTIAVVEPGWKEKLLLGEPDSAGWVFKFEVDTYFGSFNYVNTHVFSDTLTSRAIKENLVKGNAYISFENLAEADGFQFYSLDKDDKVNAIMGDSVQAKDVKALHVVSPYPVQFELVKNGETIDRIKDVYEYQFDPLKSSGVYRIVASVRIGGKWLAWVFTNPIYLY